MSPNERTQIRAADYGLPLYFDLQARIGHTKHLGGIAATRRLAELCQLGPGLEVLCVGSGSGISSAYFVKHYGCVVVGLDILPEMVASAERWARAKGLRDQLEFHLGDAQELPFEDNRFDVVLCESVNVFIPDKRKSMGEYVRVLKPGGCLGLNEAIWIKTPSEQVAEIIVEATGQQFHDSQVWRDLMRDAGLLDLVVEENAMSMGVEARNQSGLLDFRSYIRILIRSVKVLISDRETRSILKYLSSSPRQYFEYMGYGLYAGRKPGG